jgi:hypothetical protein
MAWQAKERMGQGLIAMCAQIRTAKSQGFLPARGACERPVFHPHHLYTFTLFSPSLALQAKMPHKWAFPAPY